MNRIDFSRALVATTVLAGLAIAPAQQAPEARGDQSRRLVRKFDFEDVVVPDIMPLPFYRHVEVSAGFPAILSSGSSCSRGSDR